MIVQRYVVICDLCGAIAIAKEGGTQRDIELVAPEVWIRSKVNPNVHVCPECARKLTNVKEKE